MLDVNNKSQSSSEVYTIQWNSGRDDSKGTLKDTKINSVLGTTIIITIRLIYIYILYLSRRSSVFCRVRPEILTLRGARGAPKGLKKFVKIKGVS